MCYLELHSILDSIQALRTDISEINILDNVKCDALTQLGNCLPPTLSLSVSAPNFDTRCHSLLFFLITVCYICVSLFLYVVVRTPQLVIVQFRFNLGLFK